MILFILSLMDRIITTDTATFHISDTFMIPTVVTFTNKLYEDIKYFKYTKPIFIKINQKFIKIYLWKWKFNPYINLNHGTN